MIKSALGGDPQKYMKVIAERFLIDLEDRVGKGNYGEVFRAYDTRDPEGRKQICVKIIPVSKFLENDVTAKTIEREIQTLNMLKHQVNNHLVNLYEYCISSNNIYLFMEFCNGGTLEELLKKRGHLTEAEAVIFLKQMCTAFETLQKNKIVHRDLKPANIMLHNKDYKVTDFGFARVLDHASQQTRLGTPYYMAPQVMAGEESTDKCDVWSLGIMTYQLLYGKLPYTAKSVVELYQAFTKKELKFPEKPVRSHAIKELIKKMLEKKEKDRFSWQELIDNSLLKIEDSRLLRNEEKVRKLIEEDDDLLSSMQLNNIYLQNSLTASNLKMEKNVEAEKKDLRRRTEVANKNSLKGQDVELLQKYRELRKEFEEGEKIIRECEDILLFERELYFFVDKTSLKLLRLHQRNMLGCFDADTFQRLNFCLMKQVLIMINKLKNYLDMLEDTRDPRIFVESVEFQNLKQIAQVDFSVLEVHFKGELAVSRKFFAAKDKDEIHQYLNDNFDVSKEFALYFKKLVRSCLMLVKELATKDGKISLLIFIKYLCACYDLREEFKPQETGKEKIYPNFFQYYEENELVKTEEELWQDIHYIHFKKMDK